MGGQFFFSFKGLNLIYYYWGRFINMWTSMESMSRKMSRFRLEKVVKVEIKNVIFEMLRNDVIWSFPFLRKLLLQQFKMSFKGQIQELKLEIISFLTISGWKEITLICKLKIDVNYIATNYFLWNTIKLLPFLLTSQELNKSSWSWVSYEFKTV